MSGDGVYTSDGTVENVAWPVQGTSSFIPMRAYPALFMAGCLSAGIAAAGYTTAPLLVWITGVVAGAVLVCLPDNGRRLVTLHPLRRSAGTAVVVLFLGGLLYRLEYHLPARHVGHYVHMEDGSTAVVVEGHIIDVPTDASYGTRFTLEAERRIVNGDTAAMRGRIQVTCWRSPYDSLSGIPLSLHQGDRIHTRGRLEPLAPKRNPADVDYSRLSKRRGIYASLTVDGPEDVRRIGFVSRPLPRLLSAVHSYVGAQMHRLVQADEARSILSALVLGERRQISSETRDRFIRTGLMHLLAVSGLHVLLVGMILYQLLQPLLLRLKMNRRLREPVRAAITLLVLLLYMLLTGARPSVVRAVVMAALFMGAAVLQRTSRTLNTLGAAAFLLLLFQPSQLFEPGFQLSFSAVAAIVSFNPVLQRWIPEALLRGRIADYGFRLTTTSVAAVVGTLPVLLHHFGRVSFAGLFLNMLAIPLTMLALAAILTALMAAAVWLPVAELFGAAAEVLVQGLLRTARLGEALFWWATLEPGNVSMWAVAGLTTGLLALPCWHRPRVRWRCLALSLLLVVTGTWTGVVSGAYLPRLEVVFFDVGHGDAALFRLPNGRHLLVDTGPRTPYSERGARTVRSHLQHYGIRHLDAVLITHPDRDHLGGLPGIARAVTVGQVLHNGQPHSSLLYDEVRHVLDSLAVPRHAVKSGDTLPLDPSVRLQVLAPAGSPDIYTNTNASSVVLRVQYGRTALLMTGDIEADSERWIAARYGSLLTSDVVKVPHHGSATSSTDPFVRLVVPDPDARSVAVVSVGRGGRYGLPNGAAVERWQRYGAVVHLTAEKGAVWFRGDGWSLEPVPWK